MRRQVVVLIVMLTLGLALAQQISVGLWLSWANKAILKGDPHEAEAYLTLGARMGAGGPAYQRQRARAAMLDGRPDDAVVALEAANALQPHSRLIYDELVEAYIAAGRLADAADLLRFLGVSAQGALAKANTDLLAGTGDQALYWYNRALALDPPSAPQILFQRATAALMAGDSRAPALLAALAAADPTFTVYEVEGATRIPAGDLRWIIDQKRWGVTFGDRAAFNAAPGTGKLWWTGDVMAALDVRQAGRYRLRVRARRDAPPPIMLSARIGGETVLTATLAEGDGAWAQLDTIVSLQPGLQSLVVRFENDDIVAGVNRDATIAWVALTPLER